MDEQLSKMKTAIEARVKAEPGNAGAWRELAQVKMMLGDVDGAENDCIECLRIDPNNGPGLVLMGNLLTNCKHDDAAAEEYYARAVAADPDSASAHANYGTLLLKRGERMKAIPELRRSIEIDPKQCVAHYMLAQCYVMMEDWHSAWMVASEALARGEVGFEDAANFARIRDGLLRIRTHAAAKGGSEPPARGEKAMEQALRQSAFDRKHAGSDPTVNMMMAMYMLGAMQRFDKMTPDQVKAVASEIAVVGTRGISTANDAVYTLKTIPGVECTGIGLPFDDAYALALQMHTPPQ